MQIIPVLDIWRGEVVHAYAGKREQYQPIRSCLTDHTKPIQVIEDLLKWYEFPIIYIADLDAIVHNQTNQSLYQALSNRFPQLEIWLDMGVRHSSDIQQLTPYSSISVVMGSETLSDLSLLENLSSRNNFILSLDKKGEEFLGKIELLQTPSLWPERVLAMQLDNIGNNQGPAYDWIAQIKSRSERIKIYAAGGVSGETDLVELNRAGVTGVLLASALHNGSVNQQMIQQLECKNAALSE